MGPHSPAARLPGLVLVDCAAYFHRWFFAGGHSDPALMGRFAKANVDGLVRFARTVQLSDALPTSAHPNKVILCHEGNNDARKSIYPLYKAHKQRPEAQDQWVAACRGAAMALPSDALVLNLPQQAFEGEADDVIAHIVQTVERRPVLICSHDIDLFQLVSDAAGVHFFDLYSRKMITAADIKRRTGVDAGGIVAFKTLAGDSGDNIPGIRGVGKKIAARLVNQYGTLERVFTDGVQKERGALPAKLREGHADAVLFERLIRIPICSLAKRDEALLKRFVQ